jgi:hypothetical protein
MKNRGMNIKHPKLRGEWAELQFMLRAIEKELHLNKPWGEVMPYDFVVEHEGQFCAGTGEVDDVQRSGRVFVHGARERGAV